MPIIVHYGQIFGTSSFTTIRNGSQWPRWTEDIRGQKNFLFRNQLFFKRFQFFIVFFDNFNPDFICRSEKLKICWRLCNSFVLCTNYGTVVSFPPFFDHSHFSAKHLAMQCYCFMLACDSCDSDDTFDTYTVCDTCDLKKRQFSEKWHCVRMFKISYIVLMRIPALWGLSTLLQISSWVTGIAPLLEMHKSDKLSRNLDSQFCIFFCTNRT